jgi:hypothetical protein
MNTKPLINISSKALVFTLASGFVVLFNLTSLGSVINKFAGSPSVADTTMLKSGNDVADLLLITVSVNNKSDELYVHFNPDATDGFDGAYDAYNLESFAGTQVPDVYTYDITGTKYSINSFPFTGIDKAIGLGFKFGTDATPVFRITGVESFSSHPDMGIYLLDTKTGNQVSLRTASEYSFSYQASDDPNRFKIKFIGITAGMTDAYKQTSGCRVFAFNRELNLQYESIKGKKGSATIIDLQGRIVETVLLDGSGSQKVLCPFPSGVYLVNISFPGFTETHKVAVR